MYYIPRGSGIPNATRLRVLRQLHIDTTTASLQILSSLVFGSLFWRSGGFTFHGRYEGKENEFETNDSRRWCRSPLFISFVNSAILFRFFAKIEL